MHSWWIFCHGHRVAGSLAVWSRGHRQFLKGQIKDCDPGCSSKYGAYWSDHPLKINTTITTLSCLQSHTHTLTHKSIHTHTLIHNYVHTCIHTHTFQVGANTQPLIHATPFEGSSLQIHPRHVHTLQYGSLQWKHRSSKIPPSTPLVYTLYWHCYAYYTDSLQWVY